MVSMPGRAVPPAVRRHRVKTGPSASLALRQKGTRLYLVAGRERLLLRDDQQWREETFPPEFSAYKWPDGWRMDVAQTGTDLTDSDRIVVQRNGQTVGTVRLNTYADRWLNDDRHWNNHAQANQIRYMHKQGGGLKFVLNETVRTPDGLLAVVGWRDVGGSGAMIQAQQLARIRPATPPTLELVRPLDLIETEWQDSPTPQRLYVLGGRLMLYAYAAKRSDAQPQKTQMRLVELAPDGKEKRNAAVFPPTLDPLKMDLLPSSEASMQPYCWNHLLLAALPKLRLLWVFDASTGCFLKQVDIP